MALAGRFGLGSDLPDHGLQGGGGGGGGLLLGGFRSGRDLGFFRSAGWLRGLAGRPPPANRRVPFDGRCYQPSDHQHP